MYEDRSHIMYSHSSEKGRGESQTHKGRSRKRRAKVSMGHQGNWTAPGCPASPASPVFLPLYCGTATSHSCQRFRHISSACHSRCWAPPMDEKAPRIVWLPILVCVWWVIPLRTEESNPGKKNNGGCWQTTVLLPSTRMCAEVCPCPHEQALTHFPHTFTFPECFFFT